MSCQLSSEPSIADVRILAVLNSGISLSSSQCPFPVIVFVKLSPILAVHLALI